MIQVKPVRLGDEFFERDVLRVAPDLVGKIIVIIDNDGIESRNRIIETEAYRGSEDLACHASKGRTPRTDVMFSRGGHVYIYLIYGIHWMLNIVTSVENIPQAVLIRGTEKYPGPGILTAKMGIDKSFNGIYLVDSEKIWIEDDGIKPDLSTGPRIGIDYAPPEWRDKEWRYFVKTKDKGQKTKGKGQK